MTRRSRLANGLMHPINTSAIILLGSYTVLWGLWVASPLWSAFDGSEQFLHMQEVAPEWCWGAVAIATGLCTVHGVVRSSYVSLTAGAAVSWCHWAMISIFFFWGDWRSTGGITAGIFAAYALFIYLNIKVNRTRMGLNITPARYNKSKQY